MANEIYWSYQSAERTPTHAELPEGVFNGTAAAWTSLSPGMRREIFRSWKRRNESGRPLGPPPY